eukprot:2257112-Lingulodinium_polyedra.AAC.1
MLRTSAALVLAPRSEPARRWCSEELRTPGVVINLPGAQRAFDVFAAQANRGQARPARVYRKFRT